MSTLRYRGRGDGAPAPAPAPARRIQFESLDLYTKVREEGQAKKPSGGTGAVSLVAVIVCLVLIASELHAYLVPKMREHLVVDPIMEDRLRINFDITFHALPCADANIDAMDVAGEQQNGLDHDISKTRLAADGTPIGSAFAHALADAGAPSPTPLPAGYCGSCYGAQAQEGQCCNTCEEVRTAYAERGWAMTGVTLESEQCLREQRYPAVESKEGEGCRLTGFMKVNKVAGNFHIAMGETHTRGANHIHQFNPMQLGKFNVSHTIHTLSFGEVYPGMKNPLDGVTRTVPEGSGVWMHHIKVVPTLFTTRGPTALPPWYNQRTSGTGTRDLAAAPTPTPTPLPPSSGVLATNQYSVTSQYRVAMVAGGRMTALPGVFFVYDISPFLVTVTRHTTTFSHLITSLFAILGGVLTLAAIIDNVLYDASTTFRTQWKAVVSRVTTLLAPSHSQSGMPGPPVPMSASMGGASGTGVAPPTSYGPAPPRLNHPVPGVAPAVGMGGGGHGPPVAAPPPATYYGADGSGASGPATGNHVVYSSGLPPGLAGATPHMHHRGPGGDHAGKDA